MPEYAVKIRRRRDGLTVANFPDIPEATAFGRDSRDALREAAKALEAAIRRRFLRGQDVPPPRTSGRLRIQQDVLAAALA